MSLLPVQAFHRLNPPAGLSVAEELSFFLQKLYDPSTESPVVAGSRPDAGEIGPPWLREVVCRRLPLAHPAEPCTNSCRKKNLERQFSSRDTLSAPLGSYVDLIHASPSSAGLLRMKSAHARLHQRGDTPEAWRQVCLDGSADANCHQDPAPGKAAVWAKPTVFISAVCSAGPKKRQNWSGNTKKERTEARSTVRLAGGNWSQRWRRFLATLETPVCASYASSASIKRERIANGQNLSNNACWI